MVTVQPDGALDARQTSLDEAMSPSVEESLKLLRKAVQSRTAARMKRRIRELRGVPSFLPEVRNALVGVGNMELPAIARKLFYDPLFPSSHSSCSTD
jgi:hypothetical protein